MCPVDPLTDTVLPLLLSEPLQRWFLRGPYTSVVESSLGEEVATADAVEGSKALIPGAIIEMTHSNGKGCSQSGNVSGTICNQATPTVFRVIDGGKGNIALAEDKEPFSGA